MYDIYLKILGYYIWRISRGSMRCLSPPEVRCIFTLLQSALGGIFFFKDSIHFYVPIIEAIFSPASKGLFHAAIVQSGSPLSPLSGLEKHPAYYSSRSNLPAFGLCSTQCAMVFISLD